MFRHRVAHAPVDLEADIGPAPNEGEWAWLSRSRIQPPLALHNRCDNTSYRRGSLLLVPWGGEGRGMSPESKPSGWPSKKKKFCQHPCPSTGTDRPLCERLGGHKRTGRRCCGHVNVNGAHHQLGARGCTGVHGGGVCVCVCVGGGSTTWETLSPPFFSPPTAAGGGQGGGGYIPALVSVSAACSAPAAPPGMRSSASPWQISTGVLMTAPETSIVAGADAARGSTSCGRRNVESATSPPRRPPLPSDAPAAFSPR